MEVVYRIYDNILASGVEAIFAFSLVLLQKNENVLLDLRFDEILQFLNNKLFNVYQVHDVQLNYTIF
jgi:ecotropic viral integration site 5 protein